MSRNTGAFEMMGNIFRNAQQTESRDTVGFIVSLEKKDGDAVRALRSLAS